MRSRWPWVGAHQLECLRWFRPRSLTSFEWSRDHAWNSARRQWGKQKQGDTSRHDSNKPADGQVNEEAGWWPWYGWSHGQGLICWDLLKQVVMHSAIYSLHEVLDRDLPRAPFHTEVAMRAAAFVILYWSESLCTSYFNFMCWMRLGFSSKGSGKATPTSSCRKLLASRLQLESRSEKLYFYVVVFASSTELGRYGSQAPSWGKGDKGSGAGASWKQKACWKTGLLLDRSHGRS